AGGDVSILATSLNDATVNATAGQGGLLAAGGANAFASITNRTRAEVGDNATIEADGTATIHAESRLHAVPTARSKTPIAAVATKEAYATALIDSETLARVGFNTSIIAGDVAVTATDIDVLGSADVDVGTNAIGSFNDAFGKVDATILAKVIVDAGASIE